MTNFENCEKMMFAGIPPYGIPEIQPEHINIRHIEWIPFNYAKTAKNRKNKGIHFLWANDILRTPYQNLGNMATTHERIAKALGSNGASEREQASAYRAAQKRYAENATAKKNGVSWGTARSVLDDIGEIEKKLDQKKRENTADVLLSRDRRLFCAHI